jgi:uncharacterized protein (TIGR04255 family)
MALGELLKPANEHHSIKECVVTLFLAAPILKPASFKKLLETDFLKTSFQQFELLQERMIDISLAQDQPTARAAGNYDIGFQFKSFKNGDIDFLLRGVNDFHRQYLSFHSLQYTRWMPYCEQLKKTMAALSMSDETLFFNAFSLHYIDEFEWLEETDIDPKLIFRADADALPTSFFSTTKASLSLETETVGVPAFFDRYDIYFNPNTNPNIRIAHNVTCVLDDLYSLKDTFYPEASVFFDEKLNEAHIRNKKSLKNLLTQDVCDLIHLV